MLKKILACTLALSCLAASVGCAKTNSDTAAPAQSTPNNGTDYTVTPDISFDISGKNIVDLSDGTGSMEYAFDASMSSLTEHASLIVEGEICNIYYTAVEHNAWTQMDVRITSCIAGEYAPGDIISVYTLGGYISMKERFSAAEIRDFYGNLSEDELENTWLLDLPEGVALPEEGEQYLFFLESSGDYLPDGTYETLLGYANSLFTIEDNGYSNEFTDVTFQRDTLEQCAERENL